jgi:hypothetical protein
MTVLDAGGASPDDAERVPPGRRPAIAGDGATDAIAAVVQSFPAGAGAATLLQSCRPDDPSVSPRSRLLIIAALERQLAWMQAEQIRWIASFARPGVSAPMGQLLDLACDGDQRVFLHEAAVQQIPIEIRADSEAFAAAVADIPQWQAVIADHAERLAAVEIGAALGVAPRTASHRVREALLLVDEHPATLEAMLAGLISTAKASMLTGGVQLLHPDLRIEVEAQLLEQAHRFTPAKFAARVEQLVIAADPEAAEERAEQAKADRKTRAYPGVDGMGRFIADLPADKVLLTKSVLDATAARFPTDLRDGRSQDQLRADIFGGNFSELATRGHVDLRAQHLPDAPSPGPAPILADPPDEHREPTDSSSDATGQRRKDPAGGNTKNCRLAEVVPDIEPWSPCIGLTVTIAASTLTGLDDDPGQLAGYGWIHAGMARALAESASTIRLAINREDTAQNSDTASADGPHPPGDDSVFSRSHREPPDRSPHAEHNADGSGEPPARCAPHTADGGHKHCHGDATCGGTLDHGRSTYRPPVAVRDFVIARDACCRFPGCSRPAERCDLDHLVPFGNGTADSPASGHAHASADGDADGSSEGGPTCPCNLDALCRAHHRAKTFTDWSAVRLPGNHLQWTSAHGFAHISHPEPTPHGKPFTAADLVALGSRQSYRTVLGSRDQHSGNDSRTEGLGGGVFDPPPF